VGQLQAALPREHYVDVDAWQTERDRVLLRSWWCAGRIDELGLTEPDRVAVVDVCGESVVVAVARSGSLHAHYNVCRHRGSQLIPADPNTGVPAPRKVAALRCPYHSWTYSLEGELLHAPHTEDVDDMNAADFRLHSVEVGTWGGFVWLNLIPRGADDSDGSRGADGSVGSVGLMAELGEVAERVRRYPLDDLVVGARLVYDVAANWKLIAENYNECYHCGPVHPELVRLVPAFGGGGRELDWENGIPHRDGAWTFTASGTSVRDRFPGLDEHERERHKGELIYPNLLLSLSADHVAAFRLEPSGPARTRIICELLFAPAEAAKPDFDPSDAHEFWDMVNRQDWAICESVQRGMSSRAYRQGWYAPMEDASLDIRRWLLPRLGGQDT
jgi:glycine betaine catabolism A